MRGLLDDNKNNGSYPYYTYDGERNDQPPITYRWKPLLSHRRWTDHRIIRHRPHPAQSYSDLGYPNAARAVLC